jgi:hypothetical protein
MRLPQHIPELRPLINRALSKQSSQRRNTRIIAHLEYRSIHLVEVLDFPQDIFRALAHAADLVQSEFSPIQAAAGLAIDDGTFDVSVTNSPITTKNGDSTTSNTGRNHDIQEPLDQREPFRGGTEGDHGTFSRNSIERFVTLQGKISGHTCSNPLLLA